METAAADLKPGERKVISDGTDGPVVEIIRKGTAAAENIEPTIEVQRKPLPRKQNRRENNSHVRYQCSNGKRTPGKIRSRYDGL
jgi:hypothetical protein